MKQIIEPIVFIDISFVRNCPWCGTDNWNEPKTMKDGNICNHPTKIDQSKVIRT